MIILYLSTGDEPADYYLSELLTLLTNVKTAKILDMKPLAVGDGMIFKQCYFVVALI
jgi:hypothetical protein